MGFLTAALSAFGGYGQGREQKRKDDLEEKRTASDDAYRNAELSQRTAEATARAQREAVQDKVNAAQGGYDPATGNPLPLPPLPPSIARYKMMADGKTLDPGAEADRLTQVGDYYAKNGRPDLGTQFKNSAAAMAQNYNRVATGGAAVSRASTAEERVKAQDYVSYNMLQNAANIAKGHDAKDIQVAQTNAASRLNVAGVDNATKLQIQNLSAKEKSAVVNLAGAWSLKNHDVDGGIRYALGVLHDQEGGYEARLRSDSAASAAGLVGLPPGADPSTGGVGGAPYAAPTYNINLGQLPNGSTQPIGIGNAPNVAPHSGPDVNDPVPGLTAKIRAHLQSGSPPRELYDALQKRVAEGKITNVQAHQIWAQANGRIAPPPVAAPAAGGGQGGGFGLNLPPPSVNRGGGSQASAPFP